ncbi:sulfate adenylyltransferase subunit CysN [Bradyrhizobium daqingense]|uniref:Multifunctional fusion protein n=1 Tax=Bradyrhizobium daqingense TaxID=993502 RepID=A0A562KTY0_9BRAD|nr:MULTISPECIES: sulfate adenylyltransferase subunit CysN [Bradyrhizobium]MDQ8731321.1 sulfate adenylyltransferase subunit CysN [Bradyrhizobium sp. LHD-71]TWH98817.1 bifunctional enzyme CysN/CysC [Bradyrhizobium daqingense]UFS87842.1 sulfate adenylyltransferase subunit CysN [Bradyrhizobium daqingense]
MDGVDVAGERASKDLLKLLTCGSVDDGKSTLIGRLLHDSKQIFQDQLSALAKDSARYGTTGDDIDLALLVDGLEAEREQGITIDVAYRFFGTSKRSFIVADTPGHEQYTRNMATGASNSDLAILLIDARKGVLIQTRRHSLICSLLGLRHVVLAVNKIDLVAYQASVFERIVSDYRVFASKLGFSSIEAIPISARDGDNVTSPSRKTPWYGGPTLLEYLETVDIAHGTADKPFRFPVQWVNRPGPDFRGFAGTVASGTIHPGDPIIAAGSGHASSVKELLTYEGSQSSATAGEAITLVLAHEIDIARGDLLVSSASRPEVSDQFAAHIIWMSDQPLIPGRSYLARIGTKTTPISVTGIKYKIDVNTREHLAAPTLGLNDIGFCNLSTGTPVAFDPYEENRKTGSFIIIDRLTNDTLGAGMIAFGLRRGTNIPWQATLVGKAERAAHKQQKPAIIWFTGLSGAGKSTIANIVERQLHAAGHHTMMLDGDNVRHGLNRDLGFTEADRVENIRRAGEVAKLLVDAGLIVLCSFISPYRAEREMVRRLVADGEFIEVFVDTPIEECARRDPKGLYAKAKAGAIKNFTGFDAPYEAPETPEIHLRTVGQQPEQLAHHLIAKLTELGLIR